MFSNSSPLLTSPIVHDHVLQRCASRTVITSANSHDDTYRAGYGGTDIVY